MILGLILNLDSLLNTFKAGLTPGNYERFVTLVAGEVTILLEKAVMKSTFSRLGKPYLLLHIYYFNFCGFWTAILLDKKML